MKTKKFTIVGYDKIEVRRTEFYLVQGYDTALELKLFMMREHEYKFFVEQTKLCEGSFYQHLLDTCSISKELYTELIAAWY